VLGAGAGAAGGGACAAIIGSILGTAAPYAAARALMTSPVQALLANRLLAQAPSSRFEALIGRGADDQDRGVRLPVGSVPSRHTPKDSDGEAVSLHSNSIEAT
jgi:hypothetical protein